ncbi:MAG: ABC transporter ATP-binding protein [Planctomycetota bacterium]|jgi:ABC-2 type transport system ATP-binding protein
MSEAAIRTEGLGRDYGRHHALESVNLAIERGRVVALLGPNGAGKTTFLRLLMGLLEPTNGQSWVLESPSRALPGQIAAKIGYMGDADEPPRWSKINQLMRLQAESSAEFDRAFFERSMTARKLDPGSGYGSLSKGQKKWVRAALVLAGRPEVLLMDEPAEGLDPSARQGLYDELRDYVTEGEATAVVATHIIGDIERIADDVAVIDRGHVIAHAALEDLREQVREVQLPADEQMPQFAGSVELLGSRVASDTRLVWVRCALGSLSELEQSLPAGSTVRSANLETFYLALTQHNSNGRDNDAKEKPK